MFWFSENEMQKKKLKTVSFFFFYFTDLFLLPFFVLLLSLSPAALSFSDEESLCARL